MTNLDEMFYFTFPVLNLDSLWNEKVKVQLTLHMIAWSKSNLKSCERQVVCIASSLRVANKQIIVLCFYHSIFRQENNILTKCCHIV